MTTIKISEIKMDGRDAMGAYAVAMSDGEMQGVSMAGEDDVLRSLSDLEPGDMVEVGTEEMEVVADEQRGECADCGDEDVIDDDTGLSASAHGDRELVCEDCEEKRAEAAKTAKMRHYKIPDWMKIHEVNEGQMVTCSYGIDMQDGVAIRKAYDASDRTTTWSIADLSDEEMGALETWCAANGAPSVAGPWEPCIVTGGAA